jgi:hypothetical protein
MFMEPSSIDTAGNNCIATAPIPANTNTAPTNPSVNQLRPGAFTTFSLNI